jgi:uncharacterized protein (DUF885 family)
MPGFLLSPRHALLQEFTLFHRFPARGLAALAASALVSLLVGTGVHAESPADAADAAFLALADQFIDTYYLPRHPSAATALGIHQYDAQLEDYSQSAVTRDIEDLAAWEARFAAADPATLGETVRGDRDLLLNYTRSARQDDAVLRGWQKNPDFYSGGITESVFGLIEREFAPPEARLKSLIARERAMPAVLAEARRNLANPPKVYTDIALDQLPGLIDFFRNDVTAAFKSVTDPGLRQEFTTSNEAVVAALGQYQSWLKSYLLPRSHGDYRIGAAAFRDKLRFDEMVNLPLEDLLALDLANMHENQREFARIASELEPDKTVAQVRAELASQHPKPDQILETFRSNFDQVIAFIGAHHIVTIPSKVQPKVVETPPFMRAITFASMDTPGPFEPDAKEAYLNVTLPEPSWTQEHTDQFMAQFSYPVITTVVVHEAYPGHYVQFLWMFDVHDRVRKIFNANSNVEGWAHYCEQMMLDQGLAQGLYPDDPRRQKFLKLGQLQDALLRNARFYVGIKLHTTKMTLAQAEDFFVKEGYQSHEVGVVETKRGTANPTYLYYTLGKLEIQKLRADVAAREGSAFSLERFHDDFLLQGGPPIKIVRRAMLGDDSPAL